MMNKSLNFDATRRNESFHRFTLPPEGKSGNVLDGNGNTVSSWFHSFSVQKSREGTLLLASMGAMTYVLVWKGDKYVKAQYEGAYGDYVSEAERRLKEAKVRLAEAKKIKRINRGCALWKMPLRTLKID